MEVVLELPFLIFNNTNIHFVEKEVTWRSYTAKKALPTTRKVELMDIKEFAKVALNKNIEAFVVHIRSMSLRSKMTIHPA